MNANTHLSIDDSRTGAKPRRFPVRNPSAHSNTSSATQKVKSVVERKIGRTIKNVRYDLKKPPFEIGAQRILQLISDNIHSDGNKLGHAYLVKFVVFNINAQILKELFWYCFCVFFQRNSDSAQLALVSSISSKYVGAIGSLDVERGPKDYIIEKYPYVLAKAVIVAFLEEIPGSRGLYTPAFYTETCQVCTCLFIGKQFSRDFHYQVLTQLFPDPLFGRSPTKKGEVIDGDTSRRQSVVQSSASSHRSYSVADVVIDLVNDPNWDEMKQESHRSRSSMSTNDRNDDNAERESESPKKDQSLPPIFDNPNFQRSSDQKVDSRAGATSALSPAKRREMFYTRTTSPIVGHYFNHSFTPVHLKPDRVLRTIRVDDGAALEKERVVRKKQMANMKKAMDGAEASYKATKSDTRTEVIKLHESLRNDRRRIEREYDFLLKSGQQNINRYAKKLAKKQMER